MFLELSEGIFEYLQFRVLAPCGESLNEVVLVKGTRLGPMFMETSTSTENC